MKEIILIALEHEAPNMAKWDNVFFTGVGKINAALTAAKVILKFKPNRIWKFGTSGRIKQEQGCYEMVNFVERDKGKCPASIEVMIPKAPDSLSYGEGYT